MPPHSRKPQRQAVVIQFWNYSYGGLTIPLLDLKKRDDTKCYIALPTAKGRL